MEERRALPARDGDMANPNAPTSRSAFDDLADLFLTEHDNAPLAHAGAAIEESNAHARRLAPTPFPTDSAAGLDPAEARFAPRGGKASLVAVAVVNLPVISGPWIDQAAALLAAQRGPTALIRHRGGKASLDLIAGREAQDAAAAALDGSIEGFDAAVQRCRRVVSLWMVEVRLCPDAPAVDLSAYDELVLLTGADEAAIVAAFHQIKRLGPIPPSVRLRLIVAGSEESAAHLAAERINQACLHSLNHGIEVCGVMARMQPIPMRHLGRFDIAGGLDARLAEALNSPAPGCDQASAQPVSTETAGGADHLPAARVALRPRLGPAPSMDGAAQRPASNRAAPRAMADEPPAARAVRAEDEAPHSPREQVAAPRPPINGRRERNADGAANSAASLVDLVEGLKAMRLECPRAPGVEFAFDAHGALHALIEDTSDDSLARLYVAIAWAGEHQALLAQLNPFLASAAASGPPVTAHLFTSRPRERRHLADGPWRVHILVRDEVDPNRVAMHLDLN